MAKIKLDTLDGEGTFTAKGSHPYKLPPGLKKKKKRKKKDDHK